MIDIRKRLLAVFQAEAREHLGRMRAILGSDGTATAGADLDEVFRRAHSLKGAARAVDLRIVESLAHPLETLFARVREGALRLDQQALDTVHRVLDGIEDGVATQISGHAAADPTALLKALDVILDAEASPPSGSAGGEFSSTREVPALNIAAPAPLAELPGAGGGAEEQTVRIDAGIVERLHRSAGQLISERLLQEIVTERVSRVGLQLAEITREWELVRKTSAAALRRLDSNPGLARLARYVNFVERHVAVMARESRDLALLQRRSAWSLKNIGEQLQQDVSSARMIVAAQGFDHFGKMLRDLAKDEGKEIEFRAAGLEVQADRMVLQALKDPLMHILRNTIAHGIETPAERIKDGKKPVGSVLLQLETQGNKLVMTVEDDGRGVDLRRVVQVAIAKGLITEAAAGLMSSEEQTQLIFHPGFSTARSVTELAGRGMGLNIVADAVARFQGTVHVQPGKRGGTAFIITVPLSVSTSRLVLVECRAQTFAIAAHAIERLLRCKLADVITLEGRPAIRVQEKLIPLASLAHLLKAGDTGVIAERETVPIVVLKSGEKRIAVAVDALLSEMEGVIKELSPIVMKAGNLSGGIIVGDGSVVLVLNVVTLIESFQRSQHVPLLKSAPPVPEKRAPAILVVDDSMTTRTLEKSILEAHGYQVMVAIDGIEALELLRSEKIDLVVSDVEMPRLDGFGLLQEIRKDPRLQKIPLLLVTSLEKRDDKERGLALGADGYIVKRKFDQKVLLDTVRQML